MYLLRVSAYVVGNIGSQDVGLNLDDYHWWMYLYDRIRGVLQVYRRLGLFGDFGLACSLSR